MRAAWISSSTPVIMSNEIHRYSVLLYFERAIRIQLRGLMEFCLIALRLFIRFLQTLHFFYFLVRGRTTTISRIKSDQGFRILVRRETYSWGKECWWYLSPKVIGLHPVPKFVVASEGSRFKNLWLSYWLPKAKLVSMLGVRADLKQVFGEGRFCNVLIVHESNYYFDIESPFESQDGKVDISQTIPPQREAKAANRNYQSLSQAEQYSILRKRQRRLAKDVSPFVIPMYLLLAMIVAFCFGSSLWIECGLGALFCIVMIWFDFSVADRACLTERMKQKISAIQEIPQLKKEVIELWPHIAFSASSKEGDEYLVLAVGEETFVISWRIFTFQKPICYQFTLPTTPLELSIVEGRMVNSKDMRELILGCPRVSLEHLYFVREEFFVQGHPRDHVPKPFYEVCRIANADSKLFEYYAAIGLSEESMHGDAGR